MRLPLTSTSSKPPCPSTVASCLSVRGLGSEVTVLTACNPLGLLAVTLGVNTCSGPAARTVEAMATMTATTDAIMNWIIRLVLHPYPYIVAVDYVNLQ